MYHNVFRKTAMLLLVFAVTLIYTGSSHADYKFDDMYGTSGKSYQWMILNRAGNTFGDTHQVPIDVSGDIITSGTGTLNVLSGRSESDLPSRELHTMFLVAADGQSDFTINFRALALANNYDVAAPYLELSTPWDRNATERDLYTATVSMLNPPSGQDYYDALWRSWNFQVARSNNTKYDSTAQYFYFQLNPTDEPSQGLPRPFIISNVYPGAADTQESALKVRTILRDASGNNANIAAYDQFTWVMNEPRTYPVYADDAQWVFVPVDDLNTDNSRINYYLSTEVINRSAIRYAAYNGNTNAVMYPAYWRFNLARYHDSPYILPRFTLHQDSHIAPGLVTVYRRAYDVNESDKIPLRLYAIDNPSTPGVYALTLNHKVLFGKRLGETYTLSAQEGSFNQLEITAFQPRTETGSVFYDNVARITGSTRSVAVPSSNIFTGSSIKRSTMPSSAIQYFTIDQAIPGNIRTASTEGLLPLHITFNIPATTIGSSVWDSLVQELHRADEGANLAGTFADHFHIYLQATTATGQPNPWDLTQELEGSSVSNAYVKQVKVFVDDQRGKRTSDTYEGVVTVSFIVMLMDGSRDGLRPELSLVSDTSSATNGERHYVVVRDGVYDNKWNMTFFIAPRTYFDNQANNDPVPANNNNSGSSSGGGGCNSGIAGVMMGILVLSLSKRGDR
ncbi:MAG: hypothetical protein IJS28_10670 [Synergistaceae bacterium]|nr:hypothetical protein [Synergistaceae bacterium]